MIFRSMFFQPGRIFKHREPPLMQYSHHRAADIILADRVDQGLRLGTCENDSLLTDDMALDDPVTAAFIQIKFSLVDGWTRRTARVVSANIPFGNIRAFQFGCPFQSA